MVGLGNVSNTSDADKPVSTAQQTALNLKANLASPTFTGTVSGVTAAMVGLGNVTNTSDANKPVSAAQLTALNLKANLASPSFTGTVSGVTAAMVGLGNASNTSDVNKPVSTAQQTALNLKANLASPTFTGTVVLPGGSTAAAPLRFVSGGTLAAPVFGAVEFDGASLYLTTNAASPVRKTLAFSEDVISEISLSSITAAPVKPVVAWGDNNSGQTNPPALANVAAVAAGEAHSLALLDDGTLVAWGLNTSGQTTIPAGLAGVTQISAGANFNLVRKNNGTVAAWGANNEGQTTLPAGITTATQVAAGMNHGLALLANGSVLAWGDNTFGQTTVPTLSNVTAIAAGYDHCLALKSDGTVVAWGRDDAGQITLPGGLSGVTAIAAGAYHSLALKTDGSLVAWGWDGGGQVTLPAGLTDVVKIAGGYAFSMALKADGSVVAWGNNSNGQTTVPSSATLVTQIAAGTSHALALRADSIPAQVARLDQDNVFTGKVGIGRTPAVNDLEVEGSASKLTAGTWLANSDRRIKSEIRPILGALEKLDQVRLVDFHYTDAYLAKHPVIEDRRYPNVIAQEFAEVFPDDVKSSGETMPDGSPILQVDTYPLTIYTAAAVQELHRENQALKQQVAAQELRLRKLEATLGE
jgi:alpha-tubulin suppressor-like RCC1 family protein